MTKTQWGPIGACYVPTLGPAELQAEIDKKAAKFPDYSSTAASTILLVVIDGSKLASIGNVAESVPSHVFASPFARMLLLVDHDRVIELQGRPAGSVSGRHSGDPAAIP